MKKKILLQSLLGGFLGLLICYAITIIISLIRGDGDYYSTAPALKIAMGSEIKAVVVQAVVSIVYGMVWANSAVIWEMDHWSILRQTATHLVITSMATFPIAYYMYWMDHSLGGISLYFGIFFLIYLLIWLTQYSAMKKRVGQINAKVKENNLSSK